MKKIILILPGLLLFIACEIGPKPINFGNDSCAYCSMTIVDRQHAAEIVTKKAKVRKFDAVECMLNYDREHSEIPVGLYLVSDFDAPGELIDATKATYLKSDEISSPMGANLSAFSNSEAAEKKRQEFGGEILEWEEVKQLENTTGIAQ
ncbi:MAG: nitrous oxide reductase accessory protein NosL [Salinimicrobium sp.]